MTNIKTEPPNNIHAEKAVLGSLLMGIKKSDKDILFSELINCIKPDDFYRAANKIIYLAMLDLFKKNKPIDNITVVEKLTEKNQLEKVGGIAYITELSNCVPSIEHCKYYVKIIKDKAICRDYLNASKYIENVIQNSDNIDSVQDKIESTVLNISRRNYNTDIIPNRSEQAIEGITDLDKRIENFKKGITISGLDTGFRKLNDITGGFQPDNLIVLAARPSVGKSALAINIAYKMAKNNIPVAYFSLEMSTKAIQNRIICSNNKINYKELKDGDLTDQQINAVVKTYTDLEKIPLFILDEQNCNINQLCSKIKFMVMRENIKIAIIDHLQIIMSVKDGENRTRELAKITYRLKSLAKELNIPILILSQLSRAIEQRGKTDDKVNKEPMLSDLRDSGGIEENADIVMFLHRNDYYNNNEEDKKLNADLWRPERITIKSPVMAYLIFRKNREGEQNIRIALTFCKQFSLFTDLTEK